MSAVAVSGRMSPQLPAPSNSSQAISRPEIKTYNPSLHVLSKPLPTPPPPKPLIERTVKPLEAGVMTAAQEKHLQELITQYVTAHVQLTLLEKEAEKAHQDAANYSKAAEESRKKIQIGEAKIAAYDQEIAAGRASIAADRAIVEEAKVKLAANNEELAKCRTIIETGKARIAANNEALAKYEETIKTGKAKIAANNEALAKYEEIIKTGKARIAANNESYAADMAKIAAGKALIVETQAKMAENNKVIDASKSKVLDTTRNFVKGGLKKVFGLDDLAMLNTFYAKNEIDYISVNTSKKCLNIDEEGMKAVVIAFLKAHKNVATLNLTYFKDEMKGNALTMLLTALPETGIAQIIMGRQLTQDERSVLETIQAKYKEANRKPLTIS